MILTPDDQFDPMAQNSRVVGSCQTAWEFSAFQFWAGLGMLLISFGWIGYVSSWKLHRSHHECEYFSDIPHYLGGAKGIATLGSYRNPTTAGSPYVTIYPPFNSLFLSAFMLSTAPIERQLDAAAIGMSALHVFAVLALWVVLTREKVSPVVGGLWCLLLATSPQWMRHATKFMSDPMFSMLVFVSAISLLRLPDKPTPRFGILITIIGSGMLLTRTAGIAFAFVIGLWSVVVGFKQRSPFWLVPGMILSSTVAGWALFARKGYSYGNYMTDHIRDEGALNYIQHSLLPQTVDFLCLDDFAEAYFTAIYNWLSVHRWPAPWIVPLTGLAIVCLCLLGIRARSTASDLWSTLAFGLYGLQVIIWPFPLGARSAMPLLPWIAVWSWSGLCALTKTPSSRRLASLGVVLALSAGVVTNMRVSRSIAEYALQNSSARELDDVIQWISTNASPEHKIGTYLGVPRVQISEKLGRPLELFRNEIVRPVTEGPTGMEGAHMTNMTDWLIYSSEDQPLMSTISNIYPVVYSSGKWEVRRRSSSGTAP